MGSHRTIGAVALLVTLLSGASPASAGLWVVRRGDVATGETRWAAHDRQQVQAERTIAAWRHAIRQLDGHVVGTAVDYESTTFRAGQIERSYTASILYIGFDALPGARETEIADLVLFAHDGTASRQASIPLSIRELESVIVDEKIPAGLAARARSAAPSRGRVESAWVWVNAGGDRVGFRIDSTPLAGLLGARDTARAPAGFQLVEQGIRGLDLTSLTRRRFREEQEETLTAQRDAASNLGGSTLLASGFSELGPIGARERTGRAALLWHGSPTDDAVTLPAHTQATVSLAAWRGRDLIGTGTARLSLADLLALHREDATASTAASILQRAWLAALGGTPDEPAIELRHSARVDGSISTLTLERLDISRVLGREPGGTLRDVGRGLGLVDAPEKPAEISDELAANLEKALELAPELNATTRERVIALRAGPAETALQPASRAFVRDAIEPTARARVLVGLIDALEDRSEDIRARREGLAADLGSATEAWSDAFRAHRDALRDLSGALGELRDALSSQ